MKIAFRDRKSKKSSKLIYKSTNPCVKQINITSLSESHEMYEAMRKLISAITDQTLKIIISPWLKIIFLFRI